MKALALLLISGTLYAQAPQSTRAATFQPCGWWRYDFDSNSYTCSYLDSRVSVPTVTEVRALEQKIQDLERRVKALEGATSLSGNP